MAGEPNGSNGRNVTNTITSTTPPPAIATYDPRDYYKTYDVMTGVRIAATLGSFFGLMVLLVLYKSKSKTEKALEDPNFTAAAVAEAEEEERQMQLALEATACQQLNPRRSSRRSLDTSSLQSDWIRNKTRFSSVGGYSSLLEAPTRMLPKLPSFTDEESPPEDGCSVYDEVYYNSNLDVPRRPSNITCSSSGSSYLERRESAVTLDYPVLPAHKFKSSRRPSSPLPEIYDFYYPIDIRVTQPTPGGSPCGSDRTIFKGQTAPELPESKVKRAPLASISSCNSSLGTDYPECEGLSYVGDSGSFGEEDENTDNEIDPFSTDSDVNSDDVTCCDKGPETSAPSQASSSTLSEQRRSAERSPCRLPDFIKSSKSSSALLEKMSLPQLSTIDVKRLSLSSGKLEKYSWAQETLF